MESATSPPPSTDPADVVVVAEEIANALHEPNTILVKVVVRTIGVERTRAFFDKTLEVEAQGGMLVADGSHRRTPGGVFFYLVRGGVSKEERTRIFPPPKAKKKRKKKKPQQTSPPPPPPTPLLWEEREPYVTEALTEPERAESVKLTIIGRPKRIVEAKTSVITIFQNPELTRSMPKGLPTPSDTKTNYAVFIATKQWNAVAASLKEHDDDALIIEGYPFFEPKMPGMAVLAYKVTTKYLEQARRVKPQAEA